MWTIDEPSRDTARAISQENVELVRRVFDEFQAAMERGDPGAWFDSEAVADNCRAHAAAATGKRIGVPVELTVGQVYERRMDA